MGSSFIRGGWKYGVQPRRLLTFALSATGKLAPTPPRDFSVHALDDAKLVINDGAAASGAGVYAAKNCFICHGADVVSAGSPAPDLRESAVAFDPQAFATLLRSGALTPNGMPQFAELTDEQIGGLYLYIRARARAAQK